MVLAAKADAVYKAPSQYRIESWALRIPTGIHQIHFDQVTEERDEHQGERHAHDDGGNRGHGPMYGGVVSGPSEPQNTDDEQWTGQHRSKQSLLRRRVAVPFGHELTIVLLHVDVDHSAECCTDSNTNENEASFAGVETAQLSPHDREDLSRSLV